MIVNIALIAVIVLNVKLNILILYNVNAFQIVQLIQIVYKL